MSTPTAPRVVLACDKFKGSLTSEQVHAALRDGLLEVHPTVEVVEVPVADGGEGTVAAALAHGYRELTVSVSGPTGRPVAASFAVDGSIAVIEAAASSGLALLPESGRSPLGASSRGVGELVLAALEHRCRTVVLAIGGVACTDGGAGMLAALGAELRDARGELLPDGGGALGELEQVSLTGLDPRLADVEFVLASDVDNPLLGPDGAAAVFAPQKGADPDDVRTLEVGLTRWRDCLQAAGVPSLAEAPGAGAAGGLGYASLAVLRAQRRPGIEVVLDLVGFAEAVRGARLVITGEGSLDSQTLGGKTPAGVAAAAGRAGVDVVAVAGRILLDEAEVQRLGLGAAYALADLEPDPATSMREAARLLRTIGGQIANRWLGSSTASD